MNQTGEPVFQSGQVGDIDPSEINSADYIKLVDHESILEETRKEM